MIIQVFSLGWKPIPSEARVTRDEVSGLKKKIPIPVWKTVPKQNLSFLLIFKKKQAKIEPLTLKSGGI